MQKLNTVHVDQFRGETYLRIASGSNPSEHMVAILDNQQKLSLAKKLLSAIKLPTDKISEDH
jgi:hypothetical protein